MTSPMQVTEAQVPGTSVVFQAQKQDGLEEVTKNSAIILDPSIIGSIVQPTTPQLQSTEPYFFNNKSFWFPLPHGKLIF